MVTRKITQQYNVPLSSLFRLLCAIAMSTKPTSTESQSESTDCAPLWILAELAPQCNDLISQTLSTILEPVEWNQNTLLSNNETNDLDFNLDDQFVCTDLPLDPALTLQMGYDAIFGSEPLQPHPKEFLGEPMSYISFSPLSPMSPVLAPTPTPPSSVASTNNALGKLFIDTHTDEAVYCNSEGEMVVDKEFVGLPTSPNNLPSSECNIDPMLCLQSMPGSEPPDFWSQSIEQALTPRMIPVTFAKAPETPVTVETPTVSSSPSCHFQTFVTAGSGLEQIRDYLVIPENSTRFTLVSNKNLADVLPRNRYSGRSTTRTRSVLSNSLTRMPENASEIPIETDLCDQFIKTISKAITPDPSSHISGVDKLVLCKPWRKNGIPQQQPQPASTIVHPDLFTICESWVPESKQRPFFRLTDELGSGVNLEELSVAISILSSRPPRRYNHYAALSLDDSGKYIPATYCPYLPTEYYRRCIARDPKDIEEIGGKNGFVEKVKTFDLYRPAFVKGCGASKYGWCDNCPEGGFYRMKNSGYLYHKNFEHGILATTYVMEDPLVIKSMKSPRGDRWMGLCGICYRWIDLNHRASQGWGTWFHHYVSCNKEYEELKLAVQRTGARVEIVELEYCPFVCS